MVPDVQTLALTCVVLLASGYAVLGVLHLVPTLRPVTTEAWPILFTETLIGGVVVGSIWLGGTVLTIALLALVWRCGFEAAKVALKRYPAITIGPVVLGGGVAAAAFLVSHLSIQWVIAVTILAYMIVIILRISIDLSRKSNVKFTLEFLAFPVLPLILFTAAGLRYEFGAWLLIAAILVETFDSYALLGGKLFGRTPAFPVLSPRKTVEGLATGAVMLMLTAGIAGAILGFSVIASGALALFVGGLAVTGDLAASALKRRSGVKDFPQVLPQQGGALDIADAWIVTTAGLVVLVTLFGLV